MAKNPWSDADVEAMRGLVAEGLSWKAIGAKVGRTHGACWQKWAELHEGNAPRKPRVKGAAASPLWSAICLIARDGIARPTAEWAALTGGSTNAINKQLWRNVDAGLAHVVRWLREERRNNLPLPVWLPKPGKSKPKPASFSMAEMSRRAREKLKEQDPIAYRLAIAKSWERKKRRRGIVGKQHAVVRALFGSKEKKHGNRTLHAMWPRGSYRSRLSLEQRPFIADGAAW